VPEEKKGTMGRWEQVVWRPRSAQAVGRRHRRPVRISAYVPDPIAAWDAPEIGGAAASIVAEADRAVADLNREAPALTGLEALARQLLRQESVASSRIEGLVIGQRRLARAAFDAGGDDTACQIVANIRAMERAIAIGSAERAFTYDDLIDIHESLLRPTRDAHLAGRVREEQNWLGGRGYSPIDAEFVPPPAEHVEGLLRDLVTFINRTDLQPTLMAAAAHAQFETIHPFIDGNGRVGRCLIHVILRRRGIAGSVVPPISPILATRADDYVRALGAWHGDDPAEWCLFFAGSAISAVREARRLADLVEALKERWLVRAGNPRRGSTARKLIEQLSGEPIMTVARAMEIAATSRPAATSAINVLAEKDILQPLGDRKWRRQFEAREVFELLDQFERELATETPGEQPARPAPRLELRD
jgi:Fic family protein